MRKSRAIIGRESRNCRSHAGASATHETVTWDAACILRPIVAAAAVLLIASACSSGQTAVSTPVSTDDPTVGPCDGVAVAVVEQAKAGSGEDADPTTTCVETDDTMTAEAALNAANITLTGTAEAGAAVVCRVNGDPDSALAIATPGGGIYSETCESTPPDYARWVVWHKPAGGDWDSTNQDITTLEASPGDTVALVFTYRGEPSTPGL